MDTAIVEIISQLGIVGILVIFAIYIIYDNYKKIFDGSKNKDKDSKESDDGRCKEAKILLNAIDQKFDDKINIMHDIIKSSINILEDKFNSKLDILDTKIDYIENKINDQPQNILDSIDQRKYEQQEKHNKQVIHQMTLAPLFHRILTDFLKRVECDHIFLGYFHNGTASMTGIPFCKFDVIAERFNPQNVKHDVEFAHLYKNVDIMVHDKLPILLLQKNQLYYKIQPDESSELKQDDEILYRRAVNRGIKQVAFNILKDINNNPIGFVGCVSYDYKKLILSELAVCACDLEGIYNEQNNLEY